MATPPETQEPALQTESVMNMIRQLSPGIDAKWAAAKSQDEQHAREYAEASKIQEDKLKNSLFDATAAPGSLCQREEDAKALAASLVNRLEAISELTTSEARREALLVALSDSYVKLENARPTDGFRNAPVVAFDDVGSFRVPTIDPVKKAREQAAEVMAGCYDHSNIATTEKMRATILLVAGNLAPEKRQNLTDLGESSGSRGRYIFGKGPMVSETGIRYKNKDLVSAMETHGYRPDGLTPAAHRAIEAGVGLRRATAGSNSPNISTGRRDTGIPW